MINNEINILWVDDEVELLKPHILFLESKGYEVDTCNNGFDAVDMARATPYDLIILDEMMPGMTGLETLPQIKEVRPSTPVIMVTKSEEESIMDKAIGSKISDYLIKPINPNQVLLSVKKHVQRQRLVTEQTTADYRAEFGKISSLLGEARTFADWCAIYRKLVGWEMELSESTDKGVMDILSYQKNEAGVEFGKFIKRNYLDWLRREDSDRPTMSHTLFRHRIIPEVEAAKAKGGKVTLLVIDNLRYDQWRTIWSQLHSWFDIHSESFYCSILPTATQYARNALFAGLMPLAIDKIMPEKWLNDNEEGAKNKYEEDFLRRQLSRMGKDGWRVSFDKLVKPESGRKLIDNFQHVRDADLSVIVYNFLDILSHARTETEIIRSLTEDEAAFRSLTRSWFEHSELSTMLRMLAEAGNTVIITSDHGTTRVENPVKVQGDRETSPNIRYKTGRNLNYNPKEVFEITRPEEAQLPQGNLTSSYIFALGRDFLTYPNNANQFIRYYRGTFQHGGVSMEEMIVPYIVLRPKN